MLRLIWRSCTYLPGWTNNYKLYTLLIRLLLKYSNVAWTSVLRDQLQLECSKTCKEVGACSYEKRLNILNLPSISYRRARSDMIETCKYLHGQYQVSQMPLQRHTDTNTQVHTQQSQGRRGVSTVSEETSSDIA